VLAIDAAVAAFFATLEAAVAGLVVSVVALFLVLTLDLAVAATNSHDAAARGALARRWRITLFARIDPAVAADLFAAQLVATITLLERAVIAFLAAVGGAVPTGGAHRLWRTGRVAAVTVE
jgi:hypothetical protein